LSAVEPVFANPGMGYPALGYRTYNIKKKA